MPEKRNPWLGFRTHNFSHWVSLLEVQQTLGFLAKKVTTTREQ